jgi:ribosomal protein S18 acetylase RimI-like enzyme
MHELATRAKIACQPMSMTYVWRGNFSNEAINRLHAEAFDHRLLSDDWWAQVNRHSLGWVCATADNTLVGFVNVAWDGAVHAFVLDTIVASTHRRLGIAKHMLALCTSEARKARCEWLHVDFEEHLRPLYFESAGFTPTHAGLIKL